MYPPDDIESGFLYDKLFLNNLPYSIREYGLNNVDEKNRDVLLMTYGWRRYIPENDLNTVKTERLKDYDYLTIKDMNPAKKGRKEISVMTIEGSDIILLNPDKDNTFILHFNSLGHSVKQIMVLPDNNSAKYNYPVEIDFSGNNDYLDRTKHIWPSTGAQEMEELQYKKPEIDLDFDTTIFIKDVTIRAPVKPVEVFYNKYQVQYRNAHTTTLTSKDFANCLDVEDIIGRLAPYKLDTKRKQVFFTSGRSFGGGFSPALIVYNDSPLWAAAGRDASKWESSYEAIEDLHASEISSVTVLKGPQGFAVYGEPARGGVIFITTKTQLPSMGNFTKEEKGKSLSETDAMKPVRIFRYGIEYYIPEKEEVGMIPEYKYRPTLLWKDEVYLDGKGPVKLKFPNNLVQGTVIVRVNGASFTNMPGATTYKYKVAGTRDKNLDF
jgi:hypothetical protein